ncbi:MAG: hypothetical protein DDT22_01038 [candidate division WS2 bacterium]|nr:hypothetical protein [Candidatus Lithacetigena glycinireducens]
MRNRFILNSAVITTEGVYSYKLLSTEQAKQWLEQGDFITTIGYEETCQAFFVLFGVKLQMNRTLIKMQKDDEALVFRLKVRLNDPSLKGELNNLNFLLENIEIGLLQKLE